MIVLERPATSEADAPGLSDVAPSEPDVPVAAPPPVADPLAHNALRTRSSSPPPDLAGFDDDDDDDATEFLSKERFLGDDPAGPSQAPAPPVKRRVRSLDALGNMPLTAQTTEGESVRPAIAQVSIVADDDDDDEDSPDTALHRQRPRRLASLAPIDVEEPDDVTLSRPIVHRKTFRPSGEGSPQRALDNAGGAPSAAWAPKGARSVIALPEGGGASNTVQAKGPASAPPPTAEFDTADETQTSADAPAEHTPDLESLGVSLSNSGEGTDTALDVQPPVQPIDPESETHTLQRPPPAAETASDEEGHRGAPTASHDPLEDEISELDENALVVDDKLPSEISSASRAAPGPDEGPPPTALVEPAESKRGVFQSGAGDAIVAPEEDAAARPPHPITAVEARPSELESIADDEPGTLIVQVPLEATVFLDGAEVGQGPLSISGLDRFATYTLRVHCPGYLPWSGSATLRGEAEGEVVPGLRSRQG